MHPSPDVLALLALGEQAGTPAEREHVAGCAECRRRSRAWPGPSMSAAVPTPGTPCSTPPDRVWEAIRAELNFGQGQGAHGSVGVLYGHRAPPACP